MELQKTEELIEKYLEGNTSLAEERVLKNFFSSGNVPLHLAKYQSLFGYYKVAKNETAKEFILPKKENNYIKWFGVAASLVFVSLIVFMFLQNNTPKQENLDTFESPEEAFVETHKALQLVANNINSGLENASYIEEYEKTKKIIFK
ncbi:hypothetical protein [uncultured Flavobacterium sp.]|uniref:hypothetical protein n=1 Tax=uncultured Flavobacterium sp. TaxID=165435 RepID=UPI0030ED1F71|tara:strand:- start:33791 stop:34231 length:441 start_codon:yes stop_codon:yes gene_type:complete